MKKINLAIAYTLIFIAGCTSATDKQLSVPPGFSIEKLNFDVPNARQMALSPAGTLFVGTRREGKVYAIPRALSDADAPVITLFADLTMPSGVAVHQGDLYIAAVSQILKVENIEQKLQANPAHSVLVNNLPTETHHGWKYIKFGPDGALYVPVGAPCNICLSEDERFASLLRMDPTTGESQIWARGIRNTVGFAWHPKDSALWFTDNGRDMLGDDIPPEELNVISKPGEHFGYPFMHSTDIKDPEFGDHAQAKGLTMTPPKLNIQAHSAALGMTFYNAQQFPKSYQNTLFIAEHGSWNRSSKVGYDVSMVTADDLGQLQRQPFITGWLIDESAWGRPNDVIVAPDGSLLVSDDQQGVIYRVWYSGDLDR